MKLETIIVGIDFSAESRAALQQATEIARMSGARVVLIHVCSSINPLDHLGAANQWRTYLHHQLVTNRKHLEEMCSSLRDHNIEALYEIVDNEPARGLIASADRQSADLVVIGTHGYSGFNRILLGSVAERVIRHSPIDVLVVRPGRMPARGYRRILVPTDFSVSAESALAAATHLVAADGAIDVHHFWHTAIFGPLPDPEVLDRQARAWASQRGTSLLDRHRREGSFQLQFGATHGNPKREILELADQGGHDLIVMGSHGRKGIGRLLLGSVAETVVRHAHCSVMVVKASQSARESARDPARDLAPDLARDPD